ncbi:MAG: NAD(P)-dependent oxidoreductase [Candidatus Margulisbacteria bacterium]|nr:NAD(P)-dependent oxidoreductase [Candidatus Margulisiibacteriota bacterium]
MKNIFVTGISGCVGHYVFDTLAANPDYHLFLFVRNPAKLKFNPSAYKNITIVQDIMDNILCHADVLKQMDGVVHIAAGWGETQLNYEHTLELFEQLDPNRVKKIIYFSTASLLGPDNKIVEGLDKFATSYIRGKYLCYKELGKLAVYDRIITLFPTWVLGGDEKHPYSHATGGIKAAVKWLWLLRFLSIDVSFHYIHARDIALIVDYLLKNETKQKEYVLGNSLITADQFIDQMCQYYKRKIYFKVPVPIDLLKKIAPCLGFKLSDWDRYCLDKKHFEYRTVNPSFFGLKSQDPSVEKVLVDLALI